MKKYTYLITIAIGALALSGVSNASAQMRGYTDPKGSDIQLVRKQEGNQHMLKGYRGVKEKRKSYRRHSDGYWYPLAAFAREAEKHRTHEDRSRPKPDIR